MGQNASLTFTGTAGQELSFNVSNSTIGTSSPSCQATIYDPNRIPLGSDYCGLGWNFIDTVVLTSTGTYTLYINPQVPPNGSLSVSVNNDQNVTTPSISIGGSAVTATTTVAGQDVVLSFTATAAQHIAVLGTNVTNPGATMNIVSPSGSVFASTPIYSGQTGFVDAQLMTAGTYQLWIQHSSAYIGGETLQIVGVLADFTGTLTIPAAGATGPATQIPTNGSLGAGQNASLSFTGTAGQKLSFNVSNSSIGAQSYACLVTIYDPNHNTVASGYCGTGASFVDTVILASTGTYTFYINPQGSATGSVAISVNNDQDVTTPAIMIGGSAVTTTTTVAGQDVRLSFTTSSAQKIGVYATNVTNSEATLSILSASGSVLASTLIYSGKTGFVDQQLTTAGTYQVLIQHASTYIGSETLQIVGVPADFTGTLTIPASGTTGPPTQVPTTGNLATGQNASLTFAGTTGQKLSFNVLNSTISSCLITIYDPSQNTVASGSCGTGATLVNTVTLASTGTYTFNINPQGSATGSVAISVNNDQDVTTPAISIGGSAVTTTTTVVGQDVRLSFTATAAQHIGVYATNVNSQATLSILSASGSVLASTFITNNPAGQTFFTDAQLTSSGTYQLWLQHWADFGSETLQIVVVPSDFTGTLTIPASGTTGPPTQVPTTGNLATGRNASLTFAGTMGQKLSFNVLNSTISSCWVTIYDPSQTAIESGYCSTASTFVNPVTLASTGTYTFYINPLGSATGSVAISVNNDQDVTTPAISIGGSAVTTTTTVVDQDVRLSFTATAAQHIGVYATNVTNLSATLSLLSPSGSTLVSNGITNSPGGQTFFIDTQLALAGTYQLLVQHYSTNIGSETLQIITVPPDFMGMLTIGGSALPFTTVIAQHANITFTAPMHSI